MSRGHGSQANPHPYGEMSERFKELVLKTSDSVRGRGFESHSRRHGADHNGLGVSIMSSMDSGLQRTAPLFGPLAQLVRASGS